MFGEKRGKLCLFSLFLFPALTVLGSSVKRYVEIPTEPVQDHGFQPWLLAGREPSAHWPPGLDSARFKGPALTPRNLTTTPLLGFSPGSAGPCLEALHALDREDGTHDSRTREHAWG